MQIHGILSFTAHPPATVLVEYGGKGLLILFRRDRRDTHSNNCDETGMG